MTIPVSDKNNSAEAWYSHGLDCQRAGDFSGALEAFRRSIKLESAVAAPWMALSALLKENAQYEDARQCLVSAVQAEPRHPIARQLLAYSHQALGYTKQAEVEFVNAIRLAPSMGANYFGLGQLYEDLGKSEEAAEAYRHAIKLSPQSPQYLANILGLGRHLDISSELVIAESLLDDLKPREKSLVAYGLGKAHDQKKEYAKAFSAYATASKARIEDAGRFDRKAFDARIDELIDIFTPDFYDQRKSWGSSSERPVFVVGLPRSGTTLTEQILASHPRCFGAGELNDLTDLATGTPDRLGRADLPWPLGADQLSREQVSALAQEYVLAASKRAPDQVDRVVDKQPLNFWHLGLVAMAFPKAKIIHCTRDIRDCGLSIFTQNFNLDQRWSTDLSDIAYYWKGYRRLMKHWKKVTGLKILEFSYEDTVADTQAAAKRLLDFVGLPWDERVLEFHKSKRAVQTPSRWQVRQPVYQSSKARWRNYEEFLGPLIEVQEGSTE